MESISYCSSILPPIPFSSNSKSLSRNRVFVRVSAIGGDEKRDFGSGGGRRVDESMIVLRKRIHEMKMAERNYEPPAEWMDWEKRIYANYDSMVCEILGVLQSAMMDSRPSLVLGVMVMVGLSLPVSTAAVVFRLMEISKGVMGGIHLG